MRNAGDLGPFVVAAAAGDTQAFGQIVAATGNLVTSIALAIVRDVELSQDIAQDVFLSAWRDLRKLRNPASFLPWLRQMTRNQAHSSLRGRIRARRFGSQLTDDEQIAAIADARPTVAEDVLAGERHALLSEALAELPDDTREVLTLFYREGQSVAQVAGLLDLSEDAVKKRLSRARQVLRQSVLERMGETLDMTAPGAAFGLAVMTALPLALPASASTLTVPALKASSANWGEHFWPGALWILKALAGAAILAAGGTAGIVLGSRALLRAAGDDEERRQLRRFRWANILTVVVTALAFEFRTRVTSNEWADLIVLGGFTIAMLALTWLWLPRIVAPRLEAAMRADPVRARAALRRGRVCAVIGWTLGLGGAWLGLLLRILR